MSAPHPHAPRPAPQVQPRYGRIVAAGGSLLVTVVATLGGLGVLPSQPATADQHAADPTGTTAVRRSTGGADPTASPDAQDTAGAMALMSKPESVRTPETVARLTVPAHSGSGRRIVFDMSDQRVWLVDEVKKRDRIRRTYPVSGSVTDNLHPGSYSVYSKSLHAVGVEDSGTMQYMVRFTRGQNAAIGFHDIPISHGRLVQTREQLGVARSHGCIRQARPDAKALWRFAPVGTKVVVVA